MPEVDLSEIDAAIIAEDWTAVLALLFACRDDPVRYVELCTHALKGSYVLGVLAGRHMAFEHALENMQPGIAQ